MGRAKGVVSWVMDGRLDVTISYCGLGRRRAAGFPQLSSGGTALAEVQVSNFNFSGKVFKRFLQGYRSVNSSELYNTFPKIGRGNVKKLINPRPCRLLLRRTLRSRSQINVGFPRAAVVPAARGCCLSPRSQARSS